jgi:hypothetical protein
VSEVRDDPDARLALMCRLYAGSCGDGTRHLPYRRAAVAFMTWQLCRGLLRPRMPSYPWSADDRQPWFPRPTVLVRVTRRAVSPG